MVEQLQEVSVVLAVIALRKADSSLVWDQMMHSKIKENHSFQSKIMMMAKCRGEKLLLL